MRKSIIAAVAATAVIAVVGGSTAYAAKSKNVTVSVDGQVQQVHTYGSTVADALAAQKIQVGERDLVAPSLDAELEEGQEIAVQYGRQLTVTADGKKKGFWTTADSVDEALADLGLRYSGSQLSTSRSAAIGRQGLELVVRTPKTVQVVRRGEVATVRSMATTVSEALTKANVSFDEDDRITPARASALRPGTNRITVVKVDVKKVTRLLPISFEKTETETDALFEGDKKTTTKGAAGKRSVGYVQTYLDGELTSTRQVASEVVSEPVTESVAVGTKPKPAPKPDPVEQPTATTEDVPVAGDIGAWERIAECESGGNWSINSGNGYYGGLQFNHETWVAYGGDAYADNAHQASKAQQIATAEKVKADRGDYGAWPVCGKKA